MNEASGHTGQMALDGDNFEIRREGFVAKATGHKPFRVRVGQLARIDWKDAGLLTNGYLRIIFVGQNPKADGAMTATQDPAAVMFTKGQQRQFAELRAALEQRLAVVPKEPPPPGVLRLGELIGYWAAQSARAANAVAAASQQSSAARDVDALEKLAALKAQGVLTDAEFMAKKAQLLGV